MQKKTHYLQFTPNFQLKFELFDRMNSNYINSAHSINEKEEFVENLKELFFM